MIYQLRWKILPGLRGLSCSDFSAVETSAANDFPLHEGAVFAEFTGEEECRGFLAHLEKEFAAQRFSNNAAAFEAVKAYVVQKRSAQ
jgi:hypothetical protein